MRTLPEPSPIKAPAEAGMRGSTKSVTGPSSPEPVTGGSHFYGGAAVPTRTRAGVRVGRPGPTGSDPSHVVESGVVSDERQPGNAGGPVAVLGHDDLRRALALTRLGVVDLVPIDEENDIGVLLDGA
jgi:hypothetical protein